MKISIRLLGCLMLLGAFPGLSQSWVELGVKGGLSVPNLTSGNQVNPISNGYGSRLGLDVAVHLEFRITRHFSVQHQLEYSSQGGKKSGKQAFSVPADLQPLFPEGQVPAYLYANYNSVARINYIMLPVLAKYRIDIGSHCGFYVAAGPFVSVVLSADNKTTGDSEIFLDEQHTQPLPVGVQSFNRTEKIKKDLHPVNAGINGHIGFNYSVGGGSVFIEGGGNYGFVNIQKNDKNGKNKTGAGVIVMGYQFRLGKLM